ncbi:DUF2911 domain-containing protein [Ginsengibacter hankyongi]|uniref:DUF2911 domain-containing protein n=1 Tax=Ginsengibacter hankyongi TaxID=2607284 RepID=A0A5J5IMI6_9BACT|nr:DUF2911 domain-containing protein [Ginsengibacter hankyongi]KAA9042149.1 DUF2911 domain-containing protein [Ginsengibacter hankyongi]
MKKIMVSKGLVLALLGVFISSLVLAQAEDKSKRPSPPATATGTVAGATVTVDYSSPAVKGRKIWGGLVPYGEVWRTGANEATIFETDKDIVVEGKNLPAGKYSLYTIPGEKEWVIIFNSKTGQWGVKNDESTTEEPASDVLRVTVKPVKSASFNERMKFVIDNNGFALDWENLEVPVSIK